MKGGTVSGKLRRTARRVGTRGQRQVRIRLLRTLGLFTPYVIADVGGLLFVIPTRGSGVARAMFVRGRRPEFPVLERTLRVLGERGLHVENTTLVDVGANVGTTTVAAIAWHRFGGAVAVEPNPANVVLLGTNIALNGLSDRARVVAAAATDHVGRGTFMNKASDGTGRLMDSTDGVDVALIRLDDEVHADEVGLLWIDTQGHELDALRGAPHLLARRPPIVAAFRRAKSGNPSPLLAFLAAAGYESFVDLRDPNLYNPTWTPTIRTLANELAYVPRRTTDLLFIPGTVWSDDGKGG